MALLARLFRFKHLENSYYDLQDSHGDSHIQFVKRKTAALSSQG